MTPIAQITREEFWSSPLGIIFIGLAVGIVVILVIRVLLSALKPKRRPHDPRATPRAKSLNYRDPE